MATWTVEAVFTNGAFRPLVPVALPDGACVTLVISGEPAPGTLMPLSGEMDETDWIWTAWAGSLGEAPAVLALEHDEG